MLGKRLFAALLAIGILSAAAVAIVAVSAPPSLADTANSNSN